MSEQKNKELEEIKNVKMQGVWMRSWTIWIEEGENKLQIIFVVLNYYYFFKTITQLEKTTTNRETIIETEDTLLETKTFMKIYTNPMKKTIIANSEFRLLFSALNSELSVALENPLIYNELSIAFFF